jgi:catechol 2,3-dioxygenase-like lactoylglutathione lyase family enzyme
MIHHISLAVKDPQKVASVLAEIIGGQVISAPPNFPQGSLFLIPGDEHGTMVEVLPFGAELRPDEVQAGFHTDVEPNSNYVAAHAYISVPTDAETILRIGAREGWLTRVCDRGPFELIECWLENRLMIEFATPEMKAKYLGFLTNPAAIEAALVAAQ